MSINLRTNTKLFAMFTAFFAATQVLAGGSTAGNGGYGVYVEKNLYLLDLVAASLHDGESVVTSDYDNDTKDAVTPIANMLFETKIARENLAEELAQKLYYLANLFGDASVLYPIEMIVSNLSRMKWSIHQDQPCADIHDEDDKKYPVRVQLAYRIRNWIRYCKFTLDRKNFVALTLHEIFYTATNQREHAKKMVALMFAKKAPTIDDTFKAYLSSLAKEANASGDDNQRRFLKGDDQKTELKTGEYTSSTGQILKVTRIDKDEFKWIREIKVLQRAGPQAADFVHTYECDSDYICRSSDAEAPFKYIQIDKKGRLIVTDANNKAATYHANR